MTDPNINANENLKPKVLEKAVRAQSVKKQSASGRKEIDFEQSLKTSQNKIEQQEDTNSKNDNIFDSFLPWGQFQAIFETKLSLKADSSLREKLDKSAFANCGLFVDAAKNSTQKEFDLNQPGGSAVKAVNESKDSKNDAQQILSQIMAGKNSSANFAVFIPFNELARNLMKYSGKFEIKLIANKIVENAKAIKAGQKMELTIDLKPEWLGNMTLNISSEKGVINVQIYAGENAKALLDKSMSELQQSLKEASLNIGSLQVFVGSQQNSNSQSDGSSNEEAGLNSDFLIENIKSPMFFANADVADYYIKMALSPYSMGNNIFSKI